MNDVTKEKIAFAVGLLAVLFTITPLLAEVGTWGYSIFGVTLTLRLLYYSLSLLLALAVYCYGSQFAFERGRKVLTTAGDALYAAALVLPVAYGLLFVATKLGHALGTLIQSPAATSIATAIGGAVAGVAATVLAYRARIRLSFIQRESQQRVLADQGVVRLRRAEELYKAGHYNVAVIEAFLAIETAARQTSIGGGKAFTPGWFREFIKTLPQSFQDDAEALRYLRNTAAHAVEPITAEQADKALRTASRLLSLLIVGPP